jgi:predicted nucleic acid-binding protein
MPYLIDSDILISQREGQPGALALLERLATEGLAISIVTCMEVYQGTLRSPDMVRAQAGLATFLAGFPSSPSHWPAPGGAPSCERTWLARAGASARAPST